MPDAVSGYTPISAIGATPKATPPVSKDLDKDTFLKLLVAQLKYQDPNSPMDTTQFMSQTAQFTSVEKLTEMAKSHTSMLQSQNFLSASNMVGRTITYPGPDNTDLTGVVTSARFSSDGPVLRVGDQDVPLSSVKGVSAGAK